MQSSIIGEIEPLLYLYLSSMTKKAESQIPKPGFLEKE